MLLDKAMRKQVADLVNGVDQFNSVIETTDPGQRDLARMTDALKTQLLGMIKIAQTAYGLLTKFVDDAP